ncbi:unnamed protein product [Protopolystoma xenopodis]|uniref:Uncharacterized protein n=1 Tax=Protopolystoma xenopodis TaxID=117903 RepID=A0A3S5ALS2_9PLAT|nr:unnamed protein product [Protopolystoma xenopodis]
MAELAKYLDCLCLVACPYCKPSASIIRLSYPPPNTPRENGHSNYHKVLSFGQSTSNWARKKTGRYWLGIKENNAMATGDAYPSSPKIQLSWLQTCALQHVNRERSSCAVRAKGE